MLYLILIKLINIKKKMENMSDKNEDIIEEKQDGPQEVKQSVFKVYPTYTSVINKMDRFLDPRIALGIIQGNEDLKRFQDFSYTHKMRVLTNIDNILKDEVEHIDVPQVAYYFAEQSKKDELMFGNISLLGQQYTSHMSRKVEKIKSKPKPTLMPTPGDSGMSQKQKEELERKQKHEIAHKSSLSKMTPFKIPNPMK